MIVYRQRYGESRGNAGRARARQRLTLQGSARCRARGNQPGLEIVLQTGRLEGIELLHQRIDCDPLALGPALETEFGELDTFGAAQEIPWEGFVENEVAEEEFPLDFEGVVVDLLIGDFRPALKEIDGLRNVGVPCRTRRIAVVLNPDIAETANGRAFFAIHLNGEEIIATHAGHP